MNCYKRVFFSSISGTNRECFYKSKCFEHFHYILELIRDCASRVRLITPRLAEETQLHSNCMVKITYTGDVTDDNIKQVTARKGNTYSFLAFEWEV